MKLCQWLNLNKYKFAHIPNESWIWWRQAMLMWLKKNRMWLAPWFPDFHIFLKNWNDLYIELKKKRNKKENWEYYSLSTDWINCSEEQKEWIKFLNTRKNINADFCFWFNEAVKFIESKD
jgi:transposase